MNEHWFYLISLITLILIVVLGAGYIIFLSQTKFKLMTYKRWKHFRDLGKEPTDIVVGSQLSDSAQEQYRSEFEKRYRSEEGI